VYGPRTGSKRAIRARSRNEIRVAYEVLIRCRCTVANQTIARYHRPTHSRMVDTLLRESIMGDSTPDHNGVSKPRL